MAASRMMRKGSVTASHKPDFVAVDCGGGLQVNLPFSSVLFFSMVIFSLLLAILLSSCAPKSAVVYTVDAMKEVSETPVVLVYHSPEPTMTVMLAPTPSQTPTLDHDPDYYYGSLTVTLDHAGQTIYLKKGQYFLLSLGQTYAWSVTLEPENIISLNRKLTPEPGEQGVYIARQPGQMHLKAIGQPACRNAEPACSRPDLLFQMTVVVQ